jgi:hypothetical protein
MSAHFWLVQLWEEAYWKRQPGEGHAHEPEHLALLLARMLNADTSFFSSVVYI